MGNQFTSPWTPEHDAWIRAKHAELGPKWSTIQKAFNATFDHQVSLPAIADYGRRLISQPPAADGKDPKESADTDQILHTEAAELAKRDAKLRAQFEAKLLNDLLEKETRTQQIIAAMRECLAVVPHEEIPRLPEPAVGGGTHQTAVALISDIHVGQVVSLEETGGLGEYSWPIFEERFERYVTSLRSIIRHHQYAHPVRKLCAFMLGDNIEGDQIFKSQRLYLDMDLMQQLFRLAEKLAAFFPSMLDLVDEIDIDFVPGNHGRIGEKGSNKTYVNWDYVLGKILEIKLEQYADRIHFHVPESFFIVKEVEGKSWLLWHGDDVKGWAGIPWYGLTRAVGSWTQMFNVMGKKFDYCAIGHFHTEMKADFTAGEMFANGSWVGTNEYALRLRSLGDPKQSLFFCHPEYGVTARYPVILKRPTA